MAVGHRRVQCGECVPCRRQARAARIADSGVREGSEVERHAWGGDAEAEFSGACEIVCRCFICVVHEDDHFADIRREFSEFVDGGMDGMRVGGGEIDLVEDD